MIISSEEQLIIGELNVKEIVEAVGTPAYIYDAEIIKQQVEKVNTLMHPDVQLFYSLKANPNPHIVDLIYSLGANLEICSLFELEIVKQIGADPNRVLYLGPGKTKVEIEKALSFGVKYFIIESFQELGLVNEIASKLKKKIEVGVRINLNATAKGSKLTMGGKPRQFGIDEELFSDIINKSINVEFVTIVGIHVYNGTRILSSDVLVENTKLILKFVEDIYKNSYMELSYIDIGGGMGIPYFENETELDFKKASYEINSHIEEFQKNINKKVPILLESGRYIVGESGVYTTEVLYTKESKGVNFAIADGGTNHHMAAGGMGNALKRNFPIKCLNKMNYSNTKKYNISGPLCTPNDVIAKQLLLPPLQPGDLIGILNSGAYGLTASPVLFLSHPLPTEVLVKGKEFKVIREKTQITDSKVFNFSTSTQDKMEMK